MEPRIELAQVIQAVEAAGDAFAYFYDRQTGETVCLPDPLITGLEDEPLVELLENSPGRFLPFPTRYEIHDYHIMADFVRSLPAGKAQAELEAAICSKGAFRRFKSGIRYHHLEQRWYTYRAEAYHKIALRWCEEHGFIPTGAEGMQGAGLPESHPLHG